MRTHLFSSYCSSQKQTSTFAIFLALLLSVCVFSVVDAYSQITIAGTKNQTVNDGVDIFSGKLANTIPLLEVKGRGDVKVGLSLPLRNFDWTLFNTYTQQNQQGQNNYYYEARLAPKLLNGVVPSSVPIMSLTRGGYGLIAKMKRSTNGVMPFAWNQITVTGLEFISNDGTVMGFRDVATDGQPINATELGCYIYPYPDPPPLPEGCSRGRVFRSVNGENAIFVSDADIYDCYLYDILGNVSACSGGVSGTLFLRDGIRIIFGENTLDENGYNVRVDRIEDRNGNYFDFEYQTNCANECPALTKITDSLKREINLTYGDSSKSGFQDTITYSGFGGATRQLAINYEPVENAMLPGHTLSPIFPGVRNICEFPNPPVCPGPNYGVGTPATSQQVVTSVSLPNNDQYRIYYNEYLEVARVRSPLGSYVDYAYGKVWPGSDIDGYTFTPMSAVQFIYRRVTGIKSYDDTAICSKL